MTRPVPIDYRVPSDPGPKGSDPSDSGTYRSRHFDTRCYRYQQLSVPQPLFASVPDRHTMARDHSVYWDTQGRLIVTLTPNKTLRPGSVDRSAPDAYR
jgi:hypothetical protein